MDWVLSGEINSERVKNYITSSIKLKTGWVLPYAFLQPDVNNFVNNVKSVGEDFTVYFNTGSLAFIIGYKKEKLYYELAGCYEAKELCTSWFNCYNYDDPKVKKYPEDCREEMFYDNVKELDFTDPDIKLWSHWQHICCKECFAIKQNLECIKLPLIK